MTYKDFATGDVFTADDADLLMRQGTIIVANQAARDAIVAPTAGMRVYRSDLKTFEDYTGSGWRTYDTGWVVVTVSTVTPVDDAAKNRLQVRRIGDVVMLRGWLSISAIAAGAAVNIASLNAQFWPPISVAMVCNTWDAAVSAGLNVSDSGVVRLVRANPAVEAVASISLSWMLA